MNTLFDAILELARTAQVSRGGIVTDPLENGIATDFIMTAGEYKDGTVFLVSSVYGEGRAYKINDNDEENIYFTPAETPQAGDIFYITGKEFPKGTLVSCVDRAVMELAPRTAEDTTLTTASDETDYLLPDGVRGIVKVEIAVNTTEPLDYRVDHHWHELPDGVLRFVTDHAPLYDDHIIRITYHARHTHLANDDDPLPDGLDERALLWQSVIHLCREGLRIYGADKKYDLDTLYAEAQAKGGVTKTRQQSPHKTTTFSSW